MARTYGNFTDFIDFSRASSGTALRKVSYGTELVTNGTFDTDVSGWSVNNANATNTVTWNSGAVDFVCDGSVSLNLTQPNLFTVGKLYQLKIDVTVNPSDVAGIKIQYTGADSSIGIVTESGSYTFNFVARGTALDIFRRTSGQVTDVTFDNISVKEVTFDQADGTLELFNHPAGIPRIEYDANGNGIGLLIEEQRTNLVTYSDASRWGPSGPVTLTTQTDFSLGIFNGVKVASGGQTWHRAHQTNLSVPSGVAYACTLFYKAGTSGKVFMNLRDNTNITETRIGGTIGSCTVLQEFAGTAELLSEELIGDGVYRMQVKFTPNATISTFSFGAGPYSTTSGEDVIILGGQLEEGSFATSLIPTSGATATRSADIADIATANFGYNPKAGTLVVEASLFNTTGSSTTFDLNDGTTSNRILINSRMQGVSASAGAVISSGANVTTDFANLSGANPSKVALSYAEDNYAVSANGSATETDTSGSVPQGVTVADIGNNPSSQKVSGHIRSIKYIPRRNTNNQLQEFTS